MKKAPISSLVIFLMMAAAIASCSRGPKVIPPDKMSRIYRDMLVADQWLEDNKVFRNAADTSLFYEPIFNKYGYSYRDYQKSVDYYLDDPERFGRILKKTQNMIEAEKNHILSKRDSQSEPEEKEVETDAIKIEK